MDQWTNLFIRFIVLSIAILVGCRLIGKRFTSQPTLFNQIVAVVIAFLVGVITLDLMENSWVPIIALGLWAALAIIINFAMLKSKMVRDIIMGKETVVINHGKVLEDNLLSVGFTPEDLLSQLRRKNIFQTANVEFAVMEPTGDISAFLQKDHQPLTAKSMGFTLGQESVPQTVIMDGVIIDEALTAMGLNRGWLHTELEKLGVAPENVFIAQVDSVGQLYVDLFSDNIEIPKPTTKELLHSTLKKCQADCELFALATKDKKSKALYSDAASELDELVQELHSILTR